jgi:(R)-2-hydroxyacyl-CoA dehydratese activating ATPase
MRLTAGIDVGSTYTKAVIADDDGRIVGRAQRPTGYNFPRAAEQTLAEALDAGGLSRHEVGYVAATGYGRYMVPFRDLAVTELTCHAQGMHKALPEVRTLLDVGGQTVKAIRVDERGRVRAFRLNDKCAAGAGAFLEKTVKYMGHKVTDIPSLTAAAAAPATVSSVCAVFAESEVINHLANGVPVEEVCAGAVIALAGRAAQLVKRVKPEPPLALTGGLTRVALIRSELERRLARKFVIAPDELGIYAGAFGAALLAHQRLRKLGAQSTDDSQGVSRQ